MTLEQAKQLQYGDVIYYRFGRSIRRYKVNGKPKTWKRDPNRIEVPIKYGLYTYDRMYTHHLPNFYLTHEEAEADTI